MALGRKPKHVAVMMFLSIF